MEKLEIGAMIFKVFEGLSCVNKSVEQKCFSFNQILNQYLHHPSKMARG